MNTKRFFAMVVAVVMVCSIFAGCNQNTDPAPSTPTTPTDPSTPTTPTTPTDPAPSTTGEPIKIGVLAPLTGDAAQYGNAVANGVKLYTDEINAAGGINGRQVVLVTYDEEADAAKAVTGYNHLMDEGVTAIIGDVTTAPTVAVVAESQADNIPIITASATASSVTYNEETDTVYGNMFRSCFIDPFQGEKMAAFAAEQLDASTAAVLYNNGSDYSTGLMDAFVAKCADSGIEVVATESYADKAVDFQGQLTNIAAKSPDVIFVPDYYETIALIAQQAKDAGVTATMLGADGWDSVMTVVTDAALIEGAYYCSGYSTKDPGEAVQGFLAAYSAAFGDEPNMFAAQAYDAAAILYAAIEKAEAAGSTDNETIIANMKDTDMDCVTGHVTFDEYNNPQKTAIIIEISEGEANFWGNY